MELHAGSDLRVGQSARVLLDGDEMVQHLAALAPLHYHLQRLLADRPEKHPGVQVALLSLHTPPESAIEVLQVEPALLASQFASLFEDPLEDVRRVLIHPLVALQCQFGEEFPEEEGGVVGAAAKVPGVGDASASDFELSHRRGLVLLDFLVVSEEVFFEVVALEGKEGVVHAKLNLL